MAPFKYFCVRSNTWAISVLLIDCFLKLTIIYYIFISFCMIIISNSILDIVDSTIESLGCHTFLLKTIDSLPTTIQLLGNHFNSYVLDFMTYLHESIDNSRYSQTLKMSELNFSNLFCLGELVKA